MLRAILPRRVLVSLGIATVFVAGVVLAGAVFRHHDPSPTHPSSSSTTAPHR
ncbi:MAG TPA: hypothetical protein VI462_15585 [Acidimicrobiia bacterium]